MKLIPEKVEILDSLMAYNIFKSRTFWTITFTFLFNGFAAISGTLPADVVVPVNAILGLVATYFHLQTGNNVSGTNTPATPAA